MKDILTGKAKEDFTRWYETNYFEYATCITHYQASIIEWLDSVGIYITIEGFFDRMLGYHRGFEVHIYQDGKHPVSLLEGNDVFENRHRATEAAIKKANEDYNSR